MRMVLHTVKTPTWTRSAYGEPVAVLDAGGTNFRRALVSFGPDGAQVEELKKWHMPGIDRPASWEELVSIAADALEPLPGVINLNQALPPSPPAFSRPWQFLYFFPLPQGQGSLRPTFWPCTRTGVWFAC